MVDGQNLRNNINLRVPSCGSGPFDHGVILYILTGITIRDENFGHTMAIKSAPTLALLALSITLSVTGFSQVANNNIENRMELKLDSGYILSSTDHATVEWMCINKALTNKCLAYHNDQWFTFTVPQAGRYYLNVSPQTCKQNFGIQAIVIEGNPCDVKTYRILRCIAKIRQQDVYIVLDSLTTNQPYLVNIDGFLGDICDFGIQLSSRGEGLPYDAKSGAVLGFSAIPDKGIVALKWALPPEADKDLMDFEVYRSSQKHTKPTLIRRVPLERNTAGLTRRNYSIIDSLPGKDAYTYEIVGVFQHMRKEILDQQAITFYEAQRSTDEQSIHLNLDYKNGTQLQILLMDEMRDQVLSQLSFTFNRALDQHQKIYVGPHLERGVRSFLVSVINLKRRQRTNYRYVVLENGSIVKK